MNNRKFQFGEITTALVCDYACQDTSGKFILAGVYSGNIAVREYPAKLILSAYIELSPNAEAMFPISAEIIVGERVLVAGTMKPVGEIPLGPMAFLIPQFECHVSDGQGISIWITDHDGHKAAVYSREIMLLQAR